MREIDLATSEVEYEAYDGRLRRMGFDHAVIACGSSVNLDLVPGMSDHAFSLKSVSDAMALRFHLMEQLEKAEVCDDPERRRWYLSCVIVGGGFSGVEVAGELNDLVRASIRFYSNFTARDLTVTLVHSREQILPEVSPTLREFARVKMQQAGIRMLLNTRVVLATADGVGLADGQMIRGGTIVCTIGTTTAQLVQWLDTPKAKGRLVTDRDMRLKGYRTSGQSATVPLLLMPTTGIRRRRPGNLPSARDSKLRRILSEFYKVSRPGRFASNHWARSAELASGTRWPRFSACAFQDFRRGGYGGPSIS